MVKKLNELEQFEIALLSVDRIKAKEIFSQYLSTLDIIKGVQELITPSLESIGAKWSIGEISLAQVYMSGRITEELVDLVCNDAAKEEETQAVIGITTLNDYHLLGKRIVYSALRSGGYSLIDFGRQEVDNLVELVEENNIRILLVSVLMLNSALLVKELKSRLIQQGLDTKLIVGGAPFRIDPELWKQVDADASGANASDAIRLVREFVGCEV